MKNSVLGLNKEELKAIIRANTTCIVRQEVNGVPLMGILPLISNESLFVDLHNKGNIAGSNFYDTAHARSKLLEVFLNCTGTRLGAVHARSSLFEHLSLTELFKSEEKFTLKKWKEVQYIPKGENILYYLEPGSIFKTNLFGRFEQNLQKIDQIHPELGVLGRGTLSLFKGLMSEISEKKWNDLNDNPATRMALQSTLFRFIQHLARAENNLQLAGESQEARIAFMKSMELAQAEISTLLTLTSPFKEEDFDTIYKEKLTHIPENLQKSVSVGVGKSAMNVFSGVNQAVCESIGERRPVRVISEGSYYEEVQVIGAEHSPENVISDTHVSQIDLYVGEFNHNVNINSKVSHYDLVDIQGEIDLLLKSKPETEHLTIAIDQTIDFVRSGNVEALLENYEEEIESGRLNFVFFRSGQKFDMFGMDHYYGSPFYMVNNGDKQWEPFESLKTDPLFKTDPLSMQWFCLANKYGFEEMENYREAVFANAKSVIKNVPTVLKDGGNSEVRISTVGEGMEPAFIDIKYIGNKGPNATVMANLLTKKFKENAQPIHQRSSFGFTHTNITVIMDEKGHPRTLRINPGLDPYDAELITEFLEELAKEIS